MGGARRATIAGGADLSYSEDVMTDQELKDLVASLAGQQAETWRQIQETDRQLKETHRELRESDGQFELQVPEGFAARAF